MRYQGGKSKIAADISSIINCYTMNVPFVSLFCGSCAVESKIKGYQYMICNDKHKYLIAMLRGLLAGYDLPDSVTEEQYKYIRTHKDDDPVLAGFVGFGCSFGGKWFGGYAKSSDRTNYTVQSKKSLLKDMASLQSAWFTNLDYRFVPIPQNAVVYADPPYQNTTNYQNEKFNTVEFWNYVRLIAQTRHIVFVSEQAAPDDFVSIWEKPFTRTIDRNKCNQIKTTEKLFTYGGAIYG